MMRKKLLFNGGVVMSECKIVVTDLPDSQKRCPFYENYPYYRCSIGGDCDAYSNKTFSCEKLIALKDVLSK